MLRRVLFVGKLIPCAHTSLFTDNIEKTGEFPKDGSWRLGAWPLLWTATAVTLSDLWYSEPHVSHTWAPESPAQGFEIA
jgi:hypothetical protein